MNSTNIIDEFNNTLNDFISKMIIQFPNETKLKTYYSAFKVTKMYNKNIPIKMFMGGCLSFTEQIKNRDAEFFKKRTEFVDKLKRCSSFTDDIGLVDYWDSLSETSRTAIWDYIQTLYVMGEMYINQDNTTIESINQFYNKISLDDSLKDLQENNTFSQEYISNLNNNNNNNNNEEQQ